jgi:hypothetical protein
MVIVCRGLSCCWGWVYPNWGELWFFFPRQFFLFDVLVETSRTTANDFTNAVTYTVTAEDTSTQEYTVTITTAAAAEGAGFGSATSPGDSGVLTLSESAETLTMIYANNSSTGITLPTGAGDAGTATLTTRFWMGETEVSNGVMAAEQPLIIMMSATTTGEIPENQLTMI